MKLPSKSSFVFENLHLGDIYFSILKFAILVTLIVLLILAGVSLSGLFSEKGLFGRAENAGNRYNEAKAREVLETVLLTDGQYEKNTNPEYNQDDFLDDLIKSEIEGSDIKGDVAIIGEYAYELDRSVPKIGRGLGRADKLVFPTVNVTAELATDKKNATINITAKEEKNGINKIEIWLLGEKIQECTYDNVKTEIMVNPPYIATQNGKYTIKAYGDLMASKTVEVTGIVASVTFEPNGNEEWQKSHSTVVTIEETADKVVKAKYVWTNSVNTPEDNRFPDTQTFKSGDTITGGNDTMTGTYYLWTMLETKSGNKAKRRSEGFNFDNEGPTITNFTAEKYSIDGITLRATAQDTKSGVVKFEFYIDGVLKEKYTQIILATTSSVTKTVNITELATGSHTCKVKVYDAKNNGNTSSKSGTTKLYAWEKYNYKNSYYKTILSFTFDNSKWQGPGVFGYANRRPSYFGDDSGAYFFKEVPNFYRERDYTTGETRVFRCNGTKKNLKTSQEIYDEYVGGSWMYVMSAYQVEGSSGSLTVFRNIKETNSTNCDFNAESYTARTSDEVVREKTSSTGVFVTSTKPNEYPNDGYKDGIYTVKSTPR